jgi:hypothetical protein
VQPFPRERKYPTLNGIRTEDVAQIALKRIPLSDVPAEQKVEENMKRKCTETFVARGNAFYH